MRVSWKTKQKSLANIRSIDYTVSVPEGYSVNPKRDKRGLTKPQQVFADNVLEVGKDQAAAMAYPDADEESHRKLASENLKHPEVLHSIGKLANEKGLTKISCVEAIKEGLSATRLFGKEGIEHADHSARLKAAEMGLKLHGELREDRTILPIPVTKEQYQDLCRTFWTEKPQ